MAKKLMAMLLAVMLLATMCWTGLAVSAETVPVTNQDALAVTTDITPLSDKSVSNFTADVDYTVKADQTASVTFDMDDSGWQTEYFCDFNNGEVWTSASGNNAMSNTGTALNFVGKGWFEADPIVTDIDDFELQFDVVSVGHSWTNANFFMRNSQYVMYICGVSAAPTIDGKKAYLYFQNRDTGERLGYNGTVAGKTVRVVSIGQRVEIYVNDEIVIDYYPTRPFTPKTGSIKATVTECAITYDNVKVSVPREGYSAEKDAYYEVALGQTVALNRVEGGVPTAVATSDVALDADKAYDFRIVRNNESVKVTANGITVLETADVAVGSGIVGVCASAEDTIDSIDVYDSASMYIADSVYDPVLIQDGVGENVYVISQSTETATFGVPSNTNESEYYIASPSATNAHATFGGFLNNETVSNIHIKFDARINRTNWTNDVYYFAGYSVTASCGSAPGAVTAKDPAGTALTVDTTHIANGGTWSTFEFIKSGDTVTVYYYPINGERTMLFTDSGKANNYINFYIKRTQGTLYFRNFKVYSITPDTDEPIVVQSGINRDAYISAASTPAEGQYAAYINITGDDARLIPVTGTGANNTTITVEKLLEDGVGAGDVHIKFYINQNRGNWTYSRLYFAGYDIYFPCSGSAGTVTVTNPIGKAVTTNGTFTAPGGSTYYIEFVKVGDTLTVYYYPKTGERTEMFSESGYAFYDAEMRVWHQQTAGLTIGDFTVYDINDKTADAVEQRPIEDAVKDTLEITSQGSAKNAVNTVYSDSYFTLKSSTEQNGTVTSNNILKNSYANAHIKFNVAGGGAWCEEHFYFAGYKFVVGMGGSGTWAPAITPPGKSAVSIPSVGDTTLSFHKGTFYTVEIIKYGSNISFYYYPAGGERLCIYTDNNATETANLSIYVRQQNPLTIKDFTVYDVVTDESVLSPAINLADEIANAEADAVITLHSDVTVDSTIAIDEAITLDLNGYKVTSTVADGYLFDVNADLTVKNGIIDIMDGNSLGVIAINTAAAVTVENVRIYGNTASGSVIRNVVDGATLTLTNTNIGTNNYIVDGVAFADITISGGNYRSTTYAMKPAVSGAFVMNGAKAYARHGVVEAIASGENATATFTNTVILTTESVNDNCFALAIGGGLDAVIESGIYDAYHPTTANKGYALKITDAGTITVNGGTITDGYTAPDSEDAILYINVADILERFDANANYQVADGLGGKYIGTTLTVAVNEAIADITGDGFIGAADVIYIRKDLLGVNNTADYYDVTGDGVVNILDLIRIKKYAAAYAANYATVIAATGGKVQNSNTPNVELVISETTLNYSEANDAIGRAAGYYVGANIYAPANVSAETLVNATYSRRFTSSVSESGWTDYTTGLSFWANKDSGDNAEKHYIGVWFSITEELMDVYAEKGMNISGEYVFDWNGDGTNDQTFTMSVVPGDGIVLVPVE